MSSTRTTHKNKTAASFLALLMGGIGVHRVYLRGARDKWALLHLACVPVAGLVIGLAPHADIFYKVLPVVLSYIAGFIEALVIGLMPDEKFDARFNPDSGRQSESNWPLALILVATMMIAATTTIATISRLFDLLYTGGAYG